MKPERIQVHIIESDDELTQAFAIRREVFIIGQAVDEKIEMDAFDANATHILATVDGKPAGTARWRITGEGSKLERFAVLDRYRGLGVGRRLVDFVIQRIDPHLPAYLNSQVAVIPFYKKMGFVVEGPVFYEADIPHRRMTLVRQSGSE